MGQYFVLVNLDKKEVFEPYFMKFEEIVDGEGAKILAYLLATPEPDGTRLWKSGESLKYFGRWAGDRVMLYGEYAPKEYKEMVGEDWHKIGEEGSEYKNITEEVRKEWQMINSSNF